MSFSFWEKESFLEGFDVVVAGSGIVGLNIAWSLKIKSPALKVLVVERGSIPQGASTRNAGVACFGSISEILADLESNSEEEVLGLIERRLNGLRKLRENLGDRNIDYQPLGGFELFFGEDEKLFSSCADKISFLNSRLSPILGTNDNYILADEKIKSSGFAGVTHCIKNSAEGQLDTGKMMLAVMEKTLRSGVKIMNGTEIVSIRDGSDHVEISCKNETSIRTGKLILATNGFTNKLFPLLDVVPARAQVLLTTPIQDLPVSGAFHFEKGFYYFRNIGDRILFGGGRNLDFKTEETSEFGLTEIVQKRLEKILSENILPGKEYEIENRWSGIMAMGNKKHPLIQSLSKNVFCAVRMSGMGVAIGSLVGEEAADMILNAIENR